MNTPLVTEAQARQDLAGEYGILFANHRNSMLENAALSIHCQQLAGELEQSQQARAQLEEKYRALLENRDELANQLRGKVIKPRKV